MLRELHVFDIWNISPIAVGTFLVTMTLGVVVHAFYTAYGDTDRSVIEQIRQDVARTASGTIFFKKGDVIVRLAHGQRVAMNAEDFAEQFELDPGSSTSAADGFHTFRATGKIWAHELTSEDVATHFPERKMMSAGSLVTVEPGDVLAVPFPAGGALYRFDKEMFSHKYARMSLSGEQQRPLIEECIPSQAETLAIWQSKMKSASVYRKTVRMNAKVAKEDGFIETIVNGVCESRGPYTKGDYIVIGSRGGRYSMRAIDFSARYDHSEPEPNCDALLAGEGFFAYKPTGTIWAHELSPDEVRRYFPTNKFMGKWGAAIEVGPSDLLAMPHPSGGEVYAIKNELFHKSYARHTLIPSETETLAHWEAVMRRDAFVCRKKVTVYAKVAEEDGALNDTTMQQEQRENDAGVDVEAEAGDVAMTSLNSGGERAEGHESPRPPQAPASATDAGDASGPWPMRLLGLLCVAATARSDSREETAYGNTDDDATALLARVAQQSKLINANAKLMREKDAALAEKDAEIARLAAVVQ